MNSSGRKTFFMVVNVDSFFVSHRLPIALMMKEKGYDVYILAKDTGHQAEIVRNGLRFINVDFERSGKNPLKELRLISILRKIYNKYQPDIIHHVTIKPFLYGSIAAKGLKHTKVINAISGLGFNFIDDRKSVVQRMVKRLMKIAFSGKVNFIFQNPDDLKFYKNLGFLKDGNHVLIKGAGVDAEAFSYTVPDETNEKIKIVITARMLYDKGIQELVAAAGLLKDKWEGRVLFQLIGGIDHHNPAGIAEADLKNMLQGGYIEWYGHRTDIKELLVASDIVCLPSYREGLPKALIEAMAIGRPIVTTDVPGCRECVLDGYNGYLVPAKNALELSLALERLISNKELRLKMGRASRDKMLLELSLVKVLNDTYDFYLSLKF